MNYFIRIRRKKETNFIVPSHKQESKRMRIYHTGALLTADKEKNKICFGGWLWRSMDMHEYINRKYLQHSETLTNIFIFNTVSWNSWICWENVTIKTGVECYLYRFLWPWYRFLWPWYRGASGTRRISHPPHFGLKKKKKKNLSHVWNHILFC